MSGGYYVPINGTPPADLTQKSGGGFVMVQFFRLYRDGELRRRVRWFTLKSYLAMKAKRAKLA